MNYWLLEPRDPFIARDGRPFHPQPGARARTLPLPLPSTIAGAFRSRAGGDPFDKNRLPDLLRRSVHGPWLVGLDEKGGVIELYFPAPSDVVYQLPDNVKDDDSKELILHRLAPMSPPAGFKTNLPKALVYPLGLEVPFDGKPARAPAFLRARHFLDWLEGTFSGTISQGELGLGPLELDARLHVALQEGGRTAKEGALFLTEGLVFESRKERLAMLAHTSLDLEPGIGRVGGEGRLSAFRKTKPVLPSCPESIAEKIVRHRACRLVLITPGIFDDGYKPALIDSEDVRATIVAAAVSSCGSASGWDFDKQRPKPTRRLASAGSVYFVKLDGEESAIRRWVESYWLKSVAEQPQDQRDGWAIAMLGFWDGEPIPFRFKGQSK